MFDIYFGPRCGHIFHLVYQGRINRLRRIKGVKFETVAYVVLILIALVLLAAGVYALGLIASGALAN